MEEQEPIIVKADTSDPNNIFLSSVETPVPEPIKYKSYCLVFLVAFAASSGYFYIGINFSLFVFFVSLLLQNLQGQDQDTAFLFQIVCSLLFVASAAGGSLVSMRLLDKFGRRKTILLVEVLSITAQFLVLVYFQPLFIITCSLNGFLSGISSVSIPIYLRELVPTRRACHFLSLQPTIFFLSLSFGLVVLKLLSLSLMDFSFLVYIVVGVIFMRFLFFSCVFTYETPRHLMETDREFECETILKVIYTEDSRVEVFQELKQDFYTQKFRRNHQGEILYLCRKVSGKIRERIGSTMLFLSQFSGFGAVLCHSQLMVENVVSESETTSWESIYFMGSTLALIGIGCFLAGFAFDRLWHKPLLVVGGAIVFLSLLAHFILLLFEGGNNTVIYFFLMVFFSIGYCFGLGTGAYSSIVVFTPRLEVGFTVFWGGLLVVLLIFFGFDALVDQSGLGLDGMFAMMTLITIIYSYVNYKEVAGLSNFEIDLVMKDSIMKYLPKREETDSA